MRRPEARRTAGFSESVIREMTRLIALHHADNGINLAQGFPDFAAPSHLKDAACQAIQADINQYAITWGAKPFRDGIADKTMAFLGLQFDPETEITVCCGATEGMISTMLGVLDPGDEVVIFEPFYENYGPDCMLSGAIPRFVPLHPPDWSFNREDLASTFNERTRAIVVNTPNNPTGKVYTREELQFILDLCVRWDCLIITDEIYEHLTYDAFEHVSPATLPGARDRTIIVNGLSKTFSVTGWRVGYVLAPAPLTSSIRKVHDFLTVGAAAPLQVAGALAMHSPPSYYRELREAYLERRDYLVETLQECGFQPFMPHGAYYVMCDISAFRCPDDVAFARFLVEELGLAVVPGSSFYSVPSRGAHQVRFAFPKRLETLKRAGERLAGLEATLARNGHSSC